MPQNKLPKKHTFEMRLMLLSLLSTVPLLALLLWVMVYAEVSIWLTLLSAFMGSMLILYSSGQIYHKSAYQFRSLSNLLDAMIKGDYSLRARPVEGHGALNNLLGSINGLAQRLSQQRSESVESQRLAHTVIKHIDVAIVALSEKNEISFLNPAAKNLFQLEHTGSHDTLLSQLAFVQSFTSGRNQVVELSLGNQQGRFNVHVEEFRESGLQHKLLFITDVRTLLRSEERKAWQSLVRVISHEINNSLSPIASISQTLSRFVSRRDKEDEHNQDIIEGLGIIADRASGLGQFVNSYKQLAKLPEPSREKVLVNSLLERVARLFEDQTIQLEASDDIHLSIDPVQFEQVLINLIKNAIESMAHSNPSGVITISQHCTESAYTMNLCDQGAGISNTDNLFVPFYSTKKKGSGIGLVLCRQIIEAHNGHLRVYNNPDAEGCCAQIEMPIQANP